MQKFRGGMSMIWSLILSSLLLKKFILLKKGVSIAEPISTVGASVSTAGASSAKDKGKAIIEEAETIETKTKVEADEEFAQRLQLEEREMYSEVEKARLLAELINERKRYFAEQRAEERRNKPLTQAQQRTYMSQYIKNIGSHTLKQLKSYSFDEIKNLFETLICTDIAKISRKQSKPDKHGHGKGKRIQEPRECYQSLETFSDHTEETRSGSTTTHTNNSLPEFESFHFDFYDDPSFPRPPPEPPDVEISLIIETNAPVINNFDELNEDECFNPGGGEINVEVNDSFTFVTWIFLPYLTHLEVSPTFHHKK
ncbi:hypothetical protein Tco_0830010 [Tanacetum coccineum]